MTRRTQWHQAGINGTTIHEALVRRYGFSGSYSAVRRFIQGLGGGLPQATVALTFAPCEAVQVDLGLRGRLSPTPTPESCVRLGCS